MSSSKHIETQAIHAGRINDEQFGSLATPLYQTSTFIFDDAQQGAARFQGEQSGYIYSRLGNPTTRQLEQRVAAMEGMEDAAATATGMAAVSASLLANLQSGDHLIASKAVYGCSYALMSHMLTKFGIEVTFVDMENPENIVTAFKPNTKAVFLESPINPNLVVLDLNTIGKICQQHNTLFIVDNTFCTPVLQKPAEFGADIVIHSATKYLNGHGDVVAGIICSTQEMIAHIKTTALKDIGATMSPHDAWLIIRGLKTLPIRMERHCDNAMKIATYLSQHEKIAHVYYPGLANDKGNQYIGKQMKAAGGVIAFELKTDIEGGAAFINRTALFSIAVSLGDAESLIQHPASMTHSPYEANERLEAGISDSLIRISCGLEHADDLIADLEQALAGVHLSQNWAA
ncbi:trans-sulfuration enzyme family protein [Thalassotalea agarivorans]|uniref:Methionine-gamma-lyase n=1 Tax=Thalassotalea agarivorans TaxID=349064 RepID=A0A1I0HKW7_THASX|nr:aminotransferase class I/II-fold pyridoxal phosphate-dependent enzyme [Thalassotalea agarivorans]SET83740.1 methionine-gamma-lyase [Thalassotalea agarivorans]